MKKLFRIPIPLFSPAALLAVLSIAPFAQAECPCTQGMQTRNQPVYSTPYYSGGSTYQSNGYAMPGVTYYRTLREIPAKKPPRVGMVDVQVSGPGAKVAVYDTHPFREEDELKGHPMKNHPNHWIFETKPLIDGIPHKYRVEVQDESGTIQARYIRLVPGRIVDLQF